MISAIRAAPLRVLFLVVAVAVCGLMTVTELTSASPVHAQEQAVTATRDATGENPPARPIDLQASAEPDSVSLTWTASTDQTVTHYAVLRRDRNDDDADDDAGVFHVIDSNAGSGVSYTDGSVSPGGSYVYRVKAVSPTGVSQWSSYVRADTAADPADLAPSGLSAKVDSGDNGVIEEVALAWDAPAEDAASVTGYEILRAVGDGDLATLVADTGSADKTYADDTATVAGERYAYRVKALRGEEASQPSDRAVAVIPKVTAVDPEPGIAEEQNTALWTATLTVGVFTLYDEDAYGCSDDAASDCADLLSEDEFSHDNTTHKIVLLSSQGEYFDIEFAQAPGQASASFILMVDGTSLAFYEEEADATFWSWDSPPAPMWSAGETVSLSIVVAAAAENTPPEFPAETATRSFPENSFAMRLGPSFSATDPDAVSEDVIEVLTYSLEGEHADFFDLVPLSGFLGSGADIWTTDRHTYDHEAVSEYNVTVKVEDVDGGTDTIAVTITVTDVDEPPLPPATPTVSAVSGSSDSLEVTWTAPDNRGKPDIESYDLRYRKGDSGDWAEGPQGVTATTATISGLDEPSAYQVQVRATNDEGDSEWSRAGALGQASNTAPVFTTYADFLTFENQVISFLVTAEDADAGDAVTYAITGGADQAIFSMPDATSGQVFAPVPDYENPRDADSNNDYLLTVTATGGTGARALTTDQDITVTVRDRAEVPVAPWSLTVGALTDTSDSLSVNWIGSVRPGIPSTESFDLRYRKGTTGDWDNGPQNVTVNWAIIDGLDPGAEYQVQVRATNADGTSGWSEIGSGSTNAPADAPAVSDVGVTSDPGPDGAYAIGDTVQVTVTFDQEVTVTGAPRIEIEVGGNMSQHRKWANFASGSGTTTLRFAYVVQAADSDTDGIDLQANKLELNGGTIQSSDGTGANLDYPQQGTQSGHNVDGVLPTPEFAATSDDGASIILLFSEPLAATTAPASAFTLSVDPGTAPAISSASASGHFVTLALAGALTGDQAVTVAYVDATQGNDAAAVQDAAGNDAANFTTGEGESPPSPTRSVPGAP